MNPSMFNLGMKARIKILILISLCSFQVTKAQNASFEFWPEVDIWYRFNASWRASSYVAVTRYFESNTRDLASTLQLDYAFGKTKNPLFVRLQDDNRVQNIKSWLIRGGYMYGLSLSDLGESYNEDMAISEVHKRIPIIKDRLLSVRFRNDMRWVGQPANFSYRFRIRAMLEKEYRFGLTSVIPYISAEPFWDSRYQKINRNRAIVGATISGLRPIALEGNVLYQYDSEMSNTHIMVLNIILHVYLEKKSTKP
jgi:hypothetical protein